MHSHQPDGTEANGNIPLELDGFVGRRAELSGLARSLDTSRLVTVTGPGGIGKSRLAARVAGARCAPPDGVWRVELAAVRDPEFLDYAVVETLGLTDHTVRAPRETLLAHLTGRRLLLVLDGFEHLVDACAALVVDLLEQLPGLSVLAVGRRPLAVAGEQVLALGPLGEDEAVELFAERAGRQGVTAGDDPHVRELCRRLDGIPLAIELAAGRLGALAPAQLLERLDDRFRLLTGGGRDALPRHRTLRTAIGWSHELCTSEERLLWSRLSVFAGQFDLEAAEYVCSGGGLHSDDVLDVLSALLAQSVVAREETATGVRYRMLDTVRAYGAEWLEATGDSVRLRRRHRDWYVGLATWCELDWFSPRQNEVAARIEAELPNLRCALEYCLTEPDGAELGQHLAGSLWFCWVGCGRLSEGRHWLERSVELEPGHEHARLKALWVLGYVAILQGDTVPALAALQECREEAERSANPTAAAYAEHRTGCLALVSDDMPRAQALLGSSLARYQEIGELNSNVLMGQVELAMARAFLGDLPDAVRLCEDVRRVCEDHGERWARSYALYVLAYAAWSEGDAARARELLTDCLACAHAFHDLLGSVLSIELLALVTVTQGDAAEAAVLQGAAASLWPSVGLPLFGSAYYNAPHELCEATVRERLGDERYEEGVRQGRALGRDAAVCRALGRARPVDGLPAPRGSARPAEAGPGMQQPAASPTRKGGETAG
ncbi:MULTISPECIES: AAA family ATPase [unclassified Streptomyces]|uniref:ATP-binding protein n=1 Tax=unclassified Streptomyces TaxID=2593676 RepID=UPI002473746B|nr:MULTISPECIES: AAA family ATPase [unclassified Streptomyces]MDH6448560.1 putative ATPase [Streptomyces sp. SAI-119]MDH6500858.1 putative ATPase [Streptomyces sp. SAI-149]